MADHKNYIAEIMYREGGLSKDPNDTASRSPVPDGSGYHTNKGITWATFVSLSPKLGYNATPQLFYLMPNEIWLKIYKVGYWDAVKGDEINSQAIANMIVQMAWGSGATIATRLTQEVLNTSFGEKLVVDGKFGNLTLAAVNRHSKTKTQEKRLFTALWNRRMRFLQSLPSFASFGNGWTNRMNALFTNGLKLIDAKVTTTFFFDSNNDSTTNL